MTSIRGHPDLNCWGGGEGQGVWTLHLKYLWLSLPIPFLQWFHSLCPKMFLKFSRFPQPQDVSFPIPTLPFPTPFQELPPSCLHQPRRFENHRLRPAIISLSFDISNFLVGRVSTFVMFCVYFFFVPSMWQKLIITFFVKLKNLPSFFLHHYVLSTWLIWRSWIESLVPDNFAIVIDVSECQWACNLVASCI